MAYYQYSEYMTESSDAFIDQQQWSSCLRSNSIDEGVGINPVMLTPQSNYLNHRLLPHYSLQYPQAQQHKDQTLEFRSPLDHHIINSLPNLFLKKLHCILTCEILPSHIFWNSNRATFTIRFETELVQKYLPQIFRFFSISSVVKLLTNYGFKKIKKQKQGVQTYDFKHPQFLPSQPKLIDYIIFENPNLDPYGEFIENFMNQFNYCKLNEYYLKSEINILEVTNLRLKGQLEQMRSNIEKLNLILYWLETGQFDKINLEEFNMLTATYCYHQSPETIEHEAILIIPQNFQSSVAPATCSSINAATPIDFRLTDALIMSETPTYDFIPPTSLKLPSGFPQLSYL